MNEHMAAQAFTVLFHRQRRNFRKIVAMLVWVPPEAVTETRSQVQVIDLSNTLIRMRSLPHLHRQGQAYVLCMCVWQGEVEILEPTSASFV